MLPAETTLERNPGYILSTSNIRSEIIKRTTSLENAELVLDLFRQGIEN